MGPQSMAFGFAILALILTLPVVLAGVIMLVRGRWPSRRGDEPRCRKCDYLLFGLSSKRCPECGTELTDRNIVQGQRYRRPGLMWSGAAMIVLGLATLTPVGFAIYQGVNWYQYKPTYFVVRDLGSPTLGVSMRAMTELARRDGAGTLAESYQNQIVERALKEQIAATPSPIASQLVDFAAKRFAVGKLSDQQMQKLLQQTCSLTLDVRPTVALGDDVPFRINVRARTPVGWTVTLRRGEVTLDSKVVMSGESAGFSRMGGMGAGGSTGNRVPSPTVGEHQLEVVAHVEVHEHLGGTGATQLLHSQDHKLTGQFTVVSGLPTDRVRPIVDTELLKQLQIAITPRDFRLDPNVEGRLSGKIVI